MIALSPAERQYIQDHLTADVRTLMLRPVGARTGTGGPDADRLDVKKLVAQIAARQKARDKLPTWYAHDALVFPPALSVEQASSERTAQYKASLLSGPLLVDLTGGMGVDTWAFAQRCDRVIYVERQPDLVDIATHNLTALGLSNVTFRAGDGLSELERLQTKAAWLYLDPHRRNEQGGKVVQLADCEPDVSDPDLRKRLWARTERILLKTSPLIDIRATIRQLTEPTGAGVEAVHVVAVQGEVKEILFVLGTAPPTEPVIHAVNLLTSHTDAFVFSSSDEQNAPVTFGDPRRYVYEPNAAVLKAGAFRLTATRFGLTKLAPNSHLYTSDERRTNFPGRAFELVQVIKPDRKALLAYLPDRKANLTVRNFPQTVAELRKKLDLREGGDTYLLATTLLNGDKRLLITHKVDVATGPANPSA